MCKMGPGICGVLVRTRICEALWMHGDILMLGLFASQSDLLALGSIEPRPASAIVSASACISSIRLIFFFRAGFNDLNTVTARNRPLIQRERWLTGTTISFRRTDLIELREASFLSLILERERACQLIPNMRVSHYNALYLSEIIISRKNYGCDDKMINVT